MKIMSSISFKISVILPKMFCDPELHNLKEVWTHQKTASLLFCFLFSLNLE